MLLRFGLLAGLCLVLVLCEEEEIIKCPGGTCVKLHLCPNGELNTDGANIIDIRFNPDNECEDYLLKCCPDPEEDEEDVDEPPTSHPIVQPDSVTMPSSGNGADPVPGTVPSLPSSTPHGTGPTGGSGNTAGPKPTPGSLGGGGGGVGNGVGGNKGNQGLNDEQVQMVGGEILPNQGQVAADQIKETDVPYPQGGGPPVPGAGSSGGEGTANKKPGGDIPPTGLGLNPTGQTNVPSGGGSGTGTGPEGAGVKQPGQPGTGSGTTGSSSPSATGPGGAGVKQPGQQGTGPQSSGSPSPSATGTGGAGAKQPGQPGTVPGSTGSPSPSATETGGAGAKQPGQPGTVPGSTGSPSPSATGPGGTGVKQPGQPGTVSGSTGSSSPSGTETGGTGVKQPGQQGTGPQSSGSPSPSATETGGAGAKQPGQPGTVPGSTGSPSPSATGPGGAGVKQPGQPGTGSGTTGSSSPSATGPGGAGAKQPGQQGSGPQSTGSPSPSATGPGGAGAIGGSNAGQPKPGVPAVPGTNAGSGDSSKTGGLPSSGGSKNPNVADTKHTHPTNGDGTNKKGQLITTERPINVPQKCGVRNVDGVGFRITGDNDGESEYGEFPWMVAILKEEKALDQVINVYQCGGSLIHPSVVLTAAHCVQNRQPTEMKVRLGEWDTQTKNEIYDYQDRDVVEIVSHAEFYKGGLFNDVALLFLDKPAELMDTVSTICLPPADFNFDLSRCFASGWGKDVFGKQGTYQVILKKIELPIMVRDKCQKALRSTRLGSRFKLHKSFICAGGEKNRDTCKGDGGSPLVCPIPGTVNQYYQAGMVAWGIGCGEDGIPGVYVNVPLFRGWIDEHLTQRNIPHSYYLPA